MVTYPLDHYTKQIVQKPHMLYNIGCLYINNKKFCLRHGQLIIDGKVVKQQWFPIFDDGSTKEYSLTDKVKAFFGKKLQEKKVVGVAVGGLCGKILTTLELASYSLTKDGLVQKTSVERLVDDLVYWYDGLKPHRSGLEKLLREGEIYTIPYELINNPRGIMRIALTFNGEGVVIFNPYNECGAKRGVIVYSPSEGVKGEVETGAMSNEEMENTKQLYIRRAFLPSFQIIKNRKLMESKELYLGQIIAISNENRNVNTYTIYPHQNIDSREFEQTLARSEYLLYVSKRAESPKIYLIHMPTKTIQI